MYNRIGGLLVKIRYKKRDSNFESLFVVGLPGFEPRQTEPKPVVLPLHHKPIPMC